MMTLWSLVLGVQAVVAVCPPIVAVRAIRLK